MQVLTTALGAHGTGREQRPACKCSPRRWEPTGPDGSSAGATVDWRLRQGVRFDSSNRARWRPALVASCVSSVVRAGAPGV